MAGEYPPIESYGVVGNLETCALVGPDGSVDWWPVPHLESPSAFGAVLDDADGGHFRLGPEGAADADRAYLAGTNVLRTDYDVDGGTLRVIDFMPPTGLDVAHGALYRKVDCSDGRVDLHVEFAPKFDYARAEPSLRPGDGAADVVASADGERLALAGDAAFEVDGAVATATETVAAAETRWFVLGHGDVDPPGPAECERALERTVDYWREWGHDHDDAEECVFAGPWHDAVVRSGLVLKLLTHPETGAIAAAPTTSLPEEIGGVRNWDYRYSWPRDAAFTVQALAHLGHLAEAGEYFEWFLDVCRQPPEAIRPVYGLHGEVDLDERVLGHLEGYRGSAPVRVGNAAVDQRQLDVYGELVLALSTAVHHGWTLPEDDWSAYRAIVDYVADSWRERDSGIWEVRTEPRHFVHSKLMCWTALDRGIAMAERSGWPAPLDEWEAERDRVRATILERGFDGAQGTFTREFDGDAVDATGLLIPQVGFLPFDDERVEGTVETIRERLETDRGLLHRYDGEDGVPGDEGTFTLCSFWLVDVLALSGRFEEARERFRELLSYEGPFGLFAEELDPAGEGGVHRGNYPQAFSHVGLINSALVLGRVRDPETPGPDPVGIWLGEGPDVPG